MICLVRADEGVGVFGLANRKLPLGRGALKLLAPLILPLVPRLKLKGMGEEDRFFLYFALQALRHGDILMVAPTIPAGIHENLPFVIFQENIEAAMAYARSRFPGEASVLVFPNGGSTYPILPKNARRNAVGLEPVRPNGPFAAEHGTRLNDIPEAEMDPLQVKTGREPL